MKTFELMQSQRPMVYDGEKDLKWDMLHKTQRAELKHEPGCFVFDPTNLPAQVIN